MKKSVKAAGEGLRKVTEPNKEKRDLNICSTYVILKIGNACVELYRTHLGVKLHKKG